MAEETGHDYAVSSSDILGWARPSPLRMRSEQRRNDVHIGPGGWEAVESTVSTRYGAGWPMGRGGRVGCVRLLDRISVVHADGSLTLMSAQYKTSAPSSHRITRRPHSAVRAKGRTRRRHLFRRSSRVGTIRRGLIWRCASPLTTSRLSQPCRTRWQLCPLVSFASFVTRCSRMARRSYCGGGSGGVRRRQRLLRDRRQPDWT